MIPRQLLSLLCVDDESDVLETLKMVFDTSGYDVETAQNGFVALQKVKKDPQRFQVIMTDIRMPGMDGFDFIEQSRSAGYTGPFVVYGGMISPDDRERLRELRVSCVILKPARAGELIAAVKDAETGL
jgi:CheY-like chemotaxis protein